MGIVNSPTLLLSSAETLTMINAILSALSGYVDGDGMIIMVVGISDVLQNRVRFISETKMRG